MQKAKERQTDRQKEMVKFIKHKNLKRCFQHDLKLSTKTDKQTNKHTDRQTDRLTYGLANTTVERVIQPATKNTALMMAVKMFLSPQQMEKI